LSLLRLISFEIATSKVKCNNPNFGLIIFCDRFIFPPTLFFFLITQSQIKSQLVHVIFKEDGHRYQKRIGAANLSLMRKIALGLLTKDTTIKKGRATKQMKAVSSPTYRDHLLKNCF
jgi:hypothetical protein